MDNPDQAPAAQGSDALFTAVYERLKAMASRRMGAADRRTLDTTALVHELYLRIDKAGELAFEHPSQFFAYAARAMRHLLADRARDRMTQRAGGDWQAVTLDGEDAEMAVASASEALAMEQALALLEQSQPRAARVVELRYFAGLSIDETAAALGAAPRTIDREWRFARAFLHDALQR